ncbi:hypothetical protein EXH44_06720 [Actinobacillus indolicus]|uniref:PEGA domain-containing protein n=1 Tax=Actinobacillus indolicus TaxID=51049 RepID=A0A4P7CG67_9PAST|nr:hypothetical protein [Actinobacillus indolicus]QBQ63946.1 hypothetical protein EXH44_06720 [Actinobacillus indolicus]
MKAFAKLAIFVLATTMMTGCATIVSDSKYPVEIQSSPEGSTFTIKDRDGKVVSTGTTPKTVILEAGAGYFKKAIYDIIFEKKGYAPKTVTLTADIDGWYWGNFAFGGPLGLLIIDPINGSMYKLPPQVEGELIPTSSPSAPKGKTKKRKLTVISIEHLDEKQKASLIALN